jgi:hypothetical protein
MGKSRQKHLGGMNPPSFDAYGLVVVRVKFSKFSNELPGNFGPLNS